MTARIMTEAEVAEIQWRADKATPGPWKWDDELMRGADWRARPIIETDGGAYGPDEKDAAFIVAARTDVPALIASHEALRAELALVRSERDRAIGRVEGLESGIRVSKGIVASRRDESAALRARVAKLEAELDELDTQFAQYRKRIHWGD